MNHENILDNLVPACYINMLHKYIYIYIYTIQSNQSRNPQTNLILIARFSFMKIDLLFHFKVSLLLLWIFNWLQILKTISLSSKRPLQFRVIAFSHVVYHDLDDWQSAEQSITTKRLQVKLVTSYCLGLSYPLKTLHTVQV